MHRRLWTSTLSTLALLTALGCTPLRPPVASNGPPPPTTPPPTPVQRCTSIDGLPDHVCTPGVVRTTDLNSICQGGTKQFRPPVTYTEPLKQQGILDYGYTDTSLASYEEDHLISLELGGDGFDPKNLWPEPHLGNFNSFQKDQVENWLHKQICSGAIPVTVAQQGIATDWRQFLPAASGEKLPRRETE